MEAQEKKFLQDIKIISKRHENEILRLSAENDELKSIIEQPHYKNSSDAKSSMISEAVNTVTMLTKETKEKEYFRTHYLTLKSRFDEMMVKFAQEESKMRALIPKN